MAGGVDGADARRYVVARLDEARAIRRAAKQLLEELEIELARLAHVLAALPEVELGGAEDVTGVREHRLAAVHQAADVVGMAVGDDHDIDIATAYSRLAPWRRPGRLRYAAAQLRIVARQPPLPVSNRINSLPVLTSVGMNGCT